MYNKEERLKKYKESLDKEAKLYLDLHGSKTKLSCDDMLRVVWFKAEDVYEKWDGKEKSDEINFAIDMIEGGIHPYDCPYGMELSYSELAVRARAVNFYRYFVLKNDHLRNFDYYYFERDYTINQQGAIDLLCGKKWDGSTVFVVPFKGQQMEQFKDFSFDFIKDKYFQNTRFRVRESWNNDKFYDLEFMVPYGVQVFYIKNAVKVPIKERERFQQENINYADNT